MTEKHSENCIAITLTCEKCGDNRIKKNKDRKKNSNPMPTLSLLLVKLICQIVVHNITNTFNVKITFIIYHVWIINFINITLPTISNSNTLS